MFGSSIEDVQKKLKEAIDNEGVEEKIKRIMLKRYGDFLRQKGIPYDALNGIALNRAYQKPKRQSHCYECLSSVDNEIDFECARCRWIVCSCGACGCGHSKFSQNSRCSSKAISADSWEHLQTRVESNASEVFKSFAEAKSAAMKNPGSKLVRHGNAAWLLVPK